MLQHMTGAPWQIQYARQAQHPNIVALLDVFVELERLVIVVRFNAQTIAVNNAECAMHADAHDYSVSAIIAMVSVG